MLGSCLETYGSLWHTGNSLEGVATSLHKQCHCVNFTRPHEHCQKSKTAITKIRTLWNLFEVVTVLKWDVLICIKPNFDFMYFNFATQKNIVDSSIHFLSEKDNRISSIFDLIFNSIQTKCQTHKNIQS